VSVELYSTHFKNSPSSKTQPDGTVIKAFYTGWQNSFTHDGFHMGYVRLHDENDFTIILDEETGFYCWAKQGADGALESTGYPVHLHDPRDLGLEPGEDHSGEVWNRILDQQRLERRGERRGGIREVDSWSLPYASPL
jgi:hypothetical protein